MELQDWEDFINPKKKISLAFIILFPKNKPQGYKEYVISFIAFPLEKMLL